MRILFDYQIFSYQVKGGASRYFYEVYHRLPQYTDTSVECSVMLSVNDYMNEAGLVSIRTSPEGFPLKNRVINAVNMLSSNIALSRNKFDVFHATYYKPYYLKRKIKQPVVVTCLDMIHEKFVQSDQITITNKKATLTRADKIVAISHNTKKDLISIYQIPESKIDVIHLASSFEPPADNSQLIPRGEEYFLFVGTRDYYKNFPRFLKAVAPLLKQRPALRLLCIGGGQFTKDEQALIGELKLEDQVTQRTVNDTVLAGLYAGAIAFFFPSLYEGFGIPVLEAMRCKCPVIISNGGSLPEVGGDAALYFDPIDSESIYSAAEAILLKPELRNELVTKGLERAKEFSWDKTAALHHQLYRDLL
jgi:glycosyltransferase involved in cell wall biosynthesis